MKQLRLLSLILALILLASSIFGCAAKTPTVEPQDDPATSQDTPEEPTVSVEYELSVRNDQIHTDAQASYLKSKQYSTPPEGENGKSENSRPQPIVLRWSRKLVGIKVQELKETAVISEDESFSNPIRIESSNSRVELTNLELGTTLYWYVEGRAHGKTYNSEVSTVTVGGNAPRNLDVGGVTNCRDLGAWKTLDGVTLRQGQIYRTGRLSAVTSDGKKLLLNDLGIKTEIDLRNETQVNNHGDSTEVSKLGSSVNYVFAPMEWEGLGSYNILTAPVNEESLLKVFEVFGDEKNYPILFHCSIGTDRTGLVAFLILGLCGVSEKDLYRDFIFSVFGKIDKVPEVARLTGFLDSVKKAEGKTLADKIETYLLSRGVTAEQIATIRKMMR